jgi:hypothetical protein
MNPVLSALVAAAAAFVGAYLWIYVTIPHFQIVAAIAAVVGFVAFMAHPAFLLRRTALLLIGAGIAPQSFEVIANLRGIEMAPGGIGAWIAGAVSGVPSSELLICTGGLLLVIDLAPSLLARHKRGAPSNIHLDATHYRAQKEFRATFSGSLSNKSGDDNTLRPPRVTGDGWLYTAVPAASPALSVRPTGSTSPYDEVSNDEPGKLPPNGSVDFNIEVRFKSAFLSWLWQRNPNTVRKVLRWVFRTMRARVRIPVDGHGQMTFVVNAKATEP